MSDYTIATNFRNKTSSDLILGDEFGEEFERIQTASNSKLDETNNLSDLTDPQAARTNAGVNNTTDTGDIADLSHTTDLFIVSDGTNWTGVAYNDARAALGFDDASADVNLNSCKVNGTDVVTQPVKAWAGDQLDVWTTPGSYSWTVPSDVGTIYVIGVAGGGGGGGTNDVGDTGGGGGGGACLARMMSVDGGETLSIVVGEGGVQGTSGGTNENGVDGGDSSITGNNQTVTIPGGAGGQRDGDGGAGGAGGSVDFLSGIFGFDGQDGEEGESSGDYGGAGGDGGWPEVRSPYYGAGGERSTDSGPGNDGFNRGGAGGGSKDNDYNGGDGGDGVILISY